MSTIRWLGVHDLNLYNPAHRNFPALDGLPGPGAGSVAALEHRFFYWALVFPLWVLLISVQILLANLRDDLKVFPR